MNPGEVVDHALRRLAWVTPDSDFSCLDLDASSSTCILQQTVRASRIYLTERGKSRIHQLENTHLVLRIGWPRSWKRATNELLGERFYLSQAKNFSDSRTYAAIACSQLGRHGQHLPHWPLLVEAALRSVGSTHRVLLVEGTTTFADVKRMCLRAKLDFCELQPAAQIRGRHDGNEVTRDDVVDWLCSSLESIDFSANAIVNVSPPLSESSPPSQVAAAPLQDVLAFALADRVFVLHARRNGVIQRLLQWRLDNQFMPLGSTFVAIPNSAAAGSRKSKATPIHDYLRSGAVGWYVTGSVLESSVGNLTAGEGVLANCRNKDATCFVALTASVKNARAFWTNSAASYLVHCTRAMAGPLPDESQEHYRDRLWLDGLEQVCRPLATLQRIVRQRKLLAGSRLTLSHQPCLSFSAVPLLELLKRRVYRSHLGRWDWEPYGLIVRRDLLASRGAREVIYGSKSEYRSLSIEDQLYFQAQGKPGDLAYDWTQEREWRLLGDLQLSGIAASDMALFVYRRQEALQIARYSNWPVFWLEDMI